MIGTRISDGGSDEATSIGLEGSSDHVLVLLVLCQPEKQTQSVQFFLFIEKETTSRKVDNL